MALFVVQLKDGLSRFHKCAVVKIDVRRMAMVMARAACEHNMVGTDGILGVIYITKV
jgi:hypothetical protein